MGGVAGLMLKKEDLIVSVDCTVKSAVGYPAPHTHGYKSDLELEVNYADAPPIRKLLFNGFVPPIGAGDRIRAYIFKAKEIREPPSSAPGALPEIHYTPRSFKTKEAAIKIEKLKIETVGDAAKVVATYITEEYLNLTENKS